MKIFNESIKCGPAEPYLRPSIEVVRVDVEAGFTSSWEDPKDPFDMETGDWESNDEDYGGSAE